MNSAETRPVFPPIVQPAHSNWPPKQFVVVVGLWTLLMHFFLPSRDQVFDLFDKHPTPETLAYVFAFVVGGHWAGDLMLLYCAYQLLRGRWRRGLIGIAFVAVNFLVFGIILANKPPYKFHY